MSEKTKVVVAIMLSIIIIYIAWMIAFPVENVTEEPNNIESGEVSNQEEDLMYTINKVSDTQLDLITTNEYTKTTTKYFFKDGKVSNVIVTEEILSGDFAEEVFAGIKADENLSQIYDEISLEGNVITMTLKQDYVNVYEGLTYQELYDELTKSLKISVE